MKKLILLAVLVATMYIQLNGQVATTSELILEKDSSGQFFTLKGYSTLETQSAFQDLVAGDSGNAGELFYRGNNVAFVALQALKKIAETSSDTKAQELAINILEEHGPAFTNNLQALKVPVTTQLISVITPFYGALRAQEAVTTEEAR